jgi:hypothetical protein
MCSRYNIAALQRQADASQISRRADGTVIYRFGPDKWADAHTLQGLLVKLIASMEELQVEVRKATGAEAPSLRSRGIDLKARLMNYQTGLLKLKEASHENVNR